MHAIGKRIDNKRSIELVSILRHGTSKIVKPDSDGYVPIQDLLTLKSFREFNTDSFYRLAEEDKKKRYEIKESGGQAFIKACQGHTISINNTSIQKITTQQAQSYGFIIHGTNNKCWQKIRQTGINRMNRQHIHFARDDENAISGIPSGCTVFLYVDMVGAINDGYEFFQSANGVIVSPGDSTGCLPPKYIIKVKTGS
ncbi:DgyrCDS6745 [Dimorphilus gyrociliatus]|uniref:2'-phosphotransferase n=1 Tax=Dimorphilus gyrociliatus TaxID=2664684 RepID=A0A7I8VTS7_9ANNE|nr:DgyrCDS6745 [Dimorphilus gyrociliatus]